MWKRGYEGGCEGVSCYDILRFQESELRLGVEIPCEKASIWVGEFRTHGKTPCAAKRPGSVSRPPSLEAHSAISCPRMRALSRLPAWSKCCSADAKAPSGGDSHGYA